MTLLDTPSKDSASSARKAMIDSQLRTSGVTADFVVKRMGQVAREEFVPAASKDIAYMDRAIPLGDGKFLASPLAQGMLLQEAAPKAGENVVLVDGGSGYLAEVLRPLVGSLKVLTPDEALQPARGGKKADLVIIDGAAEQVPEALVRRMADGGRVATGLVDSGVTRIAIGRKSGKDVALMPIADIGIPRLAAFDKPKGWSF